MKFSFRWPHFRTAEERIRSSEFDITIQEAIALWEEMLADGRTNMGFGGWLIAMRFGDKLDRGNTGWDAPVQLTASVPCDHWWKYDGVIQVMAEDMAGDGFPVTLHCTKCLTEQSARLIGMPV